MTSPQVMITCACGATREVAACNAAKTTRCEACQVDHCKATQPERSRRHRDRRRPQRKRRPPAVIDEALHERYANDPWLAGFVAGEGCFQIVRRRNPNGAMSWHPFFSISLRDDDAEVLRELCAAFGGSLGWAREHLGNPKVSWNVSDKRSLARLIDYFDRFPLRAKKALDYMIWREAALIYLDRGSRTFEIAVLRQKLQIVRAYSALPGARWRRSCEGR